MKMQTFRKPHQWITFWLEKYIDVLTGLKYDGEKRKKYWAVLKLFLESLPGNPRNLSLNDVHEFIEVDPEERLQPVQLFFQHIARSRPHIDMLKKFGSVPPEPRKDDGGEQAGIDRFAETLKEQKSLSDRTVKNYCTAVSSYLKWAAENDLDNSAAHIEKYCEFLTSIRQLAPRTVAMHQTALKLFFENSNDTSTDTKK